MSTAAPITADQLFNMHEQGNRCELVDGELRMMSPSGWKHGNVVGRLQTKLGRYVYDNDLGEMFGAETVFLLRRDPDTVRAPDIAFIARQNLPSEKPTEAYWPGPPDFAVEVLSPNDRTRDVDEKIREWIVAGAQMVWVVDPQVQTVTIYRSTTEAEVLTRGQLLCGAPLMAGFSCAVDEIFPSP